MSSPHVKSLTHQTPTFSGPLGSIVGLSAKEFPLLKRLSARKLVLEIGAFREPHWHANAHELGYVETGSILLTIALNHSARESFVVGEGEMYFVPSGAMHAIQNLGDQRAELILAFTHEEPEDFGIAGAFACMTDAVLGNTFGLPASAFDCWNRAYSSPISLAAGVENVASHVNALKFAIEAQSPQIDLDSGTAKLSDENLWPALQNIAMYSLRITDQGMREPHWHPQTAEMGYVRSGHGRMTVLNADGTSDTFLINPGDLYYIPAAYPHHIENIGDDVLHILVYFDQSNPGDVGFRSVVSDYPRDVLAASFGLTSDQLPDFPLSEIDSLLVQRLNPIDP